MTHGTRVLALAMLAATTMATMTGCSDDPATTTSKAGTFYGTTTTVGLGKGRSWVKLDDAGNPTAIGLSLTDSAMMGLSTQPFPPQQFFLSLPSQASATPFNHIGLDWGAAGHAPMDIYGLPHFDMHFYMIDTATQGAISPLDSVAGRAMPDSTVIPTSYFTPPPGEIVPGMGIHWVDATSHELHPGSTFDHTLIYGFWKGSMVFIEPMITRAFLETKQSVTADMKQPAKYAIAGKYYPTKYSIRFDAATKEHVIALEGLTKR